MDKSVKDYLSKERVSALTVLLTDHTPHSTTMHFSHIDEPLIFYFSADKRDRKCQLILNGKEVKAALVIGFSEDNWLTFQAEGVVGILSSQSEINKVKNTHYAKHPNSKKFEKDPNTVFLVFRPTWWRFSDLNVDPPVLIESK